MSIRQDQGEKASLIRIREPEKMLLGSKVARLADTRKKGWGRLATPGYKNDKLGNERQKSEL